MNNLKAWFEGLESREQRLVSVGGVVAIIALFFFVIWNPLNKSLADSKQKLESKKQLAVWTQDTLNKIKQAKSSTRRSSGSLTQVINQTSRQSNIQITRLQPKNDQLQVWIDLVEFNQLMRWISQLQQKHSIGVTAIDLGVEEAPGYVKVRKLQFEKL